MNNTAWHFTGNTLRDGSPIPAIGETLVFPHKVEMCRSGYHWSLKPHQALKFAPGATLHKVNFGGYVEIGDEKGVSSERTIIASIDATYLLRRFAADQALGVSHLWDMPKVVHDYLTTLDESEREAARDAVRDAARVDARSYAWCAAWDAAWCAALDAAWDAARGAAGDAARGAAWAAAWDAARGAAWAAAEAAAKVAAWSAARNAALDAAMQEFDRRVYAAFE
jgi:hypothetical protein